MSGDVYAVEARRNSGGCGANRSGRRRGSVKTLVESAGRPQILGVTAAGQSNSPLVGQPAFPLHHKSHIVERLD